MRVFFYQQSGDTRGGAGRRTARYAQADPRGQYPRPRDNQFAQARPRMPVQTPPPPVETPPPRRQPQEPPEEVYRDGDAQYVKPRKPYVPDYIRAKYPQGEPPEPEAQAFDVPMQQEDYIQQQNSYVLMSEKNREPKPAMNRRTLIALVIVAVVLLAGVSAAQLIFSAQTQAVFAARAAAEETIKNRHPLSYRELIEREAIKNNLNPAFVAAIILNESSFDPRAESSVGARGLMQMMEDTAVWIFDQIGTGTYSFDLMYDAETNVTYGCWYLKYLSDKFGGDPILVAAAFHSGQTNVLNWLNNSAYSADQKTIPLDKMPDGNTKAYVGRVMNAFAAYRRLYFDEVTA